MVFRRGRFLEWVIALLPAMLFPAANCRADDVQQFVQRAVQNELAKDRADHSLWMFLDVDRKDGHTTKQWVASARDGSLSRVIAVNGQPVPENEQRQKMDSFIHDTSAQARQKKSDQHDDQQATEMLNLLPQAFIWTKEGEKDNCTLLHFKPNPQFRPPDFQARVFAAMEGDMAVDNHELRIASLKGHLIRDVKIMGGFLASMYAGGTFDVERRQTGDGVWQITETHVHINGHALLFKTISEQEDDEKTQFKELPANTTMQQAERELLAERK